LGLRLALNPIFGAKAPYVTFFLAAAGSAALAGLVPGIVATVTGAALASLAHIIDPTDPFALPRFLISSGFVCWICEVLISARERARNAEQRLLENEKILKAAQAELRFQAEELRRSNRDLEQFAFVASHDMQEPLRTVNIYTELLLRRVSEGDPKDRDQFATYIRDGVVRMERLIHDLLHYSRIIHGEAERHPVDAGEAAREAVKVNQTLVELTGADVQIGPLPIVLAGEAHVTQVFQNLLSNAIKYRKGDQRPQIHITAELQNGLALFRVKDNGMGFEPEHAEKVFKLFTRLNGNQYGGSGLGLAICQRIVERYGGYIGAESRPGEGSTFFFTLPVAKNISEELQTVGGFAVGASVK
jgi:light-regulated signal transduction histidine kinase (bacteriophytochrome)